MGSFPAKAWGFQDLHGNLWERCLDHWQQSYDGAPGYGSAWLVRDARKYARRLLRGSY